jgi:hypothetical protein
MITQSPTFAGVSVKLGVTEIAVAPLTASTAPTPLNSKAYAVYHEPPVMVAVI